MCEKCGKKFWTYIRAKQTYDDIVVSTRAVQINKKEQNISFNLKVYKILLYLLSFCNIINYILTEVLIWLQMIMMIY